MLKQDHFRQSRGGYARLLEISCRKCQGFVCLYQKDGPGNLRRLYVDRLVEPQSMVLQEIGDLPALKCKSCQEILGTPYIYPKEDRKAIRLYQDAVEKKVRRIN